jgi:hypothetical protein
MRRFLFVAILFICSSSLADFVWPEAEKFNPNAPLIWAVTNRLPSSMEIYATVQTNFSLSVLSNAMAMGSFKPLDIKSQSKDEIAFEARKNTVLVRSLKISQTEGSIDYFNAITDYSSIHGVPSYDETKRLALDYLRRFGCNTNQVSAVSPRTELTVDNYNKRGGQMTNEAVGGRGIMLRRQINGVNCSDNFLIEFGNDAVVSRLDMNWRVLKPNRLVKMPRKRKFLDQIKSGQTTVLPDGNGGVAPSQAGSFTITKAALVYRLLNPKEFGYPSIDFYIVADMGKTNDTTFRIECPIQDAP